MSEPIDIRIVEYEPEYRQSFKELNEEWISAYFTMEEADYEVLNRPEEFIINPGGAIVMALLDDEPVGTCALIKIDDADYDFKLVKMAVSPKLRGTGIGLRLGEEIVRTAKARGASRIYLESNTVLTPAINLYRKLGFREIEGRSSEFERVNIQMGLDLSQGR